MKLSISIFDRIEALASAFRVPGINFTRSCQHLAGAFECSPLDDLSVRAMCYQCSVAESIRCLTAISAFLDGKAEEASECKRELALLILDRAKIDAQIGSLTTVEKMRQILNT
jgi:hypothetical protein